jgi:hypothetical protein
MIMIDVSARVVQQHKLEALPTETRGSADGWNAGITSDGEQIVERKRRMRITVDEILQDEKRRVSVDKRNRK